MPEQNQPELPPLHWGKKPTPEISKPALYVVLIAALFLIIKFINIQVENAKVTIGKLTDSALQAKAPHLTVKSSPVQTIAMPKAADISGWQTYRNEKYGFEVKYPANYRMATSTGLPANLNGLEYAGDLYGDKILKVRIIVQKTKESEAEHFASIDKLLLSSKPIRIDGENAIEYISCGSASCSAQIDLIKNNQLFQFLSFESIVWPGKKLPPDTQMPFPAIFATFKFL